ncbi:hypothetical protein IGI04_014537 [Brassica rapa subsp. trilocularis]|uniref:Cytochrome P450 n=1 Tax=Brassica rapa subsp. trilocularis TaxID=1813537 RepID=A0ABQ7MMI2_BRACM|nr:hypothetical protein IGI04_014537 [Brassica rapa subsp. trilocularis]
MVISTLSSCRLKSRCKGGLWNSFRGRSSVYLLELSSSQMETDIENSSNVTTLISRSLLRFLVDMRGVDIDQLMTGMQDYISYCTSILLHNILLLNLQNPEKLGKLGEGAPTNESLKKLESPYFWDNPQEFEPDRFLRTKESNGIEGWAGFDPSRSPGALYPNEIIADFQSLPFGGGPRKCIGEQFALMESTVALANVWNRLSLRI